MKIVYMGTPHLAVTCLDALHQSSHEISAVVTQPDRPKGRGRVPTAPPVKIRALELKLPVLQPQSLDDTQFQKKLKHINADLFVVVAFSILPDSLLSLCHYGAINLHGSLLPKYRGAAPIQWAIAKGETVSGVTLFQLDPKMDHGKILKQKHLTIGPNETSGEYGERLLDMGSKSLVHLLDDMENNSVELTDQDHTQASFARKLRKEDGKINWTWPAQTIHNRIRGFNPYPICFTGHTLNSKSLRILRSEITDIPSIGPGLLKLKNETSLLVGCGDVMLKLLEVQLEGKSSMTGHNFWNGLQSRENFKLVSL